MRSASNLRKLAIAMHHYQSDHGHLPPAARGETSEEPLLSWRVWLMPYLEGESPFNDLRRDEPWDSSHNIRFLNQRFPIYRPVVGEADECPLTTYYQVFTGRDTLFEPGRKLTLKMVNAMDGAANTLLIIEAGESVAWMKPADLPYAADRPLPPLGGIFIGRSKWYQGPMRANGMTACFADASTRYISRSRFDEALFRTLITWNDGQRADVSDMLD